MPKLFPLKTLFIVALLLAHGVASAAPVTVIAELHAKDDDAIEQILALTEPLIAATRAEPGCITYTFHQDAKEPRYFFFFEQFANHEALKAHQQAPHMKTWLNKVTPLTDGEITVRVLNERHDTSGGEHGRILCFVTGHADLGETGVKTGIFLEELATPYWMFVDEGFAVDMASISGGPAPLDPKSVKAPGERHPSDDRFLSSAAAMAKLANTHALDAVDFNDYDAIYFPGGHGTMYDLPVNDVLASKVADVFERGVPVGAVCHGPAVLVNVKRSDGKPLVDGYRVSAFTDEEEEAVGLTEEMPFLLESKLREQGATFVEADNFQPKAVRDRNLVTGQNPASSKLVAEKLLDAIRDSKSATSSDDE